MTYTIDEQMLIDILNELQHRPWGSVSSLMDSILAVKNTADSEAQPTIITGA